jgi:hypothetical protein
LEMKNIKKILGSLFAASVIGLIMLAGHPAKTFAAVATSEAQIKSGDYSYVNATTIQAKIGGQTITFKADTNNVWIGGIIFNAQNYDCTATITYTGGDIDFMKTHPSSAIGKQVAINIDYKPNASKCTKTSPDSFNQTIANMGLAGAFFTQTDASTITSVLDGENFVSNGANIYLSSKEKSCVDRIVVQNGGATYFELDSSKGQSISDGNKLGIGNIAGCKVLRINSQTVTSESQAITLSKQTAPVAGLIQTAPVASNGATTCDPKAGNCTCTSQGCVVTGSAATTATQGQDVVTLCELKPTVVNWLLCSMLDWIDQFMQEVTNLINSQLNFDTKTFLNASVKQSWAVFRNLSSALIVIVLLIMIFSQAVGGGGFLDAYTIRKLLPRLIFAVIFIQISWYAAIWFIELANDLGWGIYNLITLPFGGPDNMELLKLLGNLGQPVPTGTAVIGAMLASGIVIFNPYLVVLVGFFIFTSVITALATLLFRQILIIACVILMPIAIVMWVLPGTQRYYKMWYDNFSKALLLFPIIGALIGAGRVFAYISGRTVDDAHNPAAIAGILPWFAVLFGYFGPYFLLPKAFRWGGQLLSMASNAINTAAKPVRDFGNKEIRDMGQRYQGKYAKAYDPNANVGSRMLNRFRSGHFIPSARSQRLTIQKGDKWNTERDEMALALLKRSGEKVMGGYETAETNEDGRMVDAGGNVVDDYALAAKKTLTGVAAMKQKWVDIMDDDDADDAMKKMAARQLVDTASWPEIQSSFTKKGNKVIDTAAWSPSITTSPDHYPKVLRSRVDAAPHIEDAAYTAGEQAGFARTDMSVQAKNFRAAYRMDYAIDKQLDNEGFATQSDGFWEDAARLSQLTEADGVTPTAEAERIRDHLQQRFAAIQRAGPTARQQMLGHMANGGKLEQQVNIALGLPPNTTGEVGGGAHPQSILDYLKDPVTGAAPGGAGGGAGGGGAGGGAGGGGAGGGAGGGGAGGGAGAGP